MLAPETSGRPLILAAIAVSLLCAALPCGHAHGDDHLLIEALTEELTRAPDADLFIRRGELFRHHQEWVRAEADFSAAARLDPELLIVDFFRARALLEAGEPQKARAFIDRYLAAAPDEPEAWFLHGDVLAALGQHEEGAGNYAEAIRRIAERLDYFTMIKGRGPAPSTSVPAAKKTSAGQE
ncbi:MAG: tetratricopeptide repeat protein [Opitutaceae bacterium]